MRASQDSIKAALDQLVESFPISKVSPMMILVAAARLYESELSEHELTTLARKAVDTLEHFPSTSKLLKLVSDVRHRKRERHAHSSGYDVELERRYREATAGVPAGELVGRFDAICAARYRGRYPALFSERQSHELDNRLAEFGLDQRGRPFFECPLQPDAAPRVEAWEPGAEG